MARPTPLHIRVFVASPSDVLDERGLTMKVLSRVQYDPILRGRISLEAVAWDQPGSEIPLLANIPPQMSVNLGLGEPSTCDIVIIVMWARMGTPLPPDVTKGDGKAYLSGTEWEFWNAWKAAEESGLPQILVYRRSEVPLVSLEDPERQEIENQWKLVSAFFRELQDPTGPTKLGVNTYENPTDFERKLETHLKSVIRYLLDLKGEIGSGGGPTASPPEAAHWEGSPFPGLRAFTEDDAPVFFGRGRDTDGLIRLLREPSHRFLAVVGASGSGKSSLVAAGMVPRIRSGAVPGGEDWVVCRFAPGEIGDDPFIALAVALEPLHRSPNVDKSALARRLREDHEALDDIVSDVLFSRSDSAELLLFIDQFEELFKLVSPRDRQPFVELVDRAVTTQRVRVVVTLRADSYSQCLEWPELAELLRVGSYPLTTPGVGSLLSMVTEPAVIAGITFESELPDRIVDDIGTEPGALPLLAFALSELFDAREAGGQLSHAAYESFGGVLGAIGSTAEETFRTASRDAQLALDEAFRHLVTVDERSVPTRKRARYADIARSAAAAELVDALTEARLLVRTGESGEANVEVAHEAIFASWPRLARWIDYVREDLRLRQQIAQTTDEWERNGRSDSFLWPHDRSPRLAAMVRRLQPSLSPAEVEFVGPLDPDRILDEVADPHTDHRRRVVLGERLAHLGDPRHGVGVDRDGVPGVAWCEVPAGEVLLEVDEAVQPFAVAPFRIARYLVTFSQYKAFAEAVDGYRRPEWWTGLAMRGEQPSWQLRELHNHPAEFVSWFEAVAYTRWLSSKLGYQVRLPTEWEWQHAAIGGNHDYQYPWGVEWDGRRANTYESRVNRTTAVGMYPLGASAVGATDMVGNVWEWCLNQYDTPRQPPALTGTDPRPVRGGAWAGYHEFARVNRRQWQHPETLHDSLGFRIATDMPAASG